MTLKEHFLSSDIPDYLKQDERIFEKTSSLVISPQTTVVSGLIARYKSARFSNNSLATFISIPISLKYVSPE